MSKTLENLPLVKDASRRNFLKLAGVMGTATAFAGTLAACGGPSSTKTTSANTAAIDPNATIEAGISYSLSTGFDPLGASSATAFAANLHFFEGLTELHPATRKVYNALAASDPVKVSDTEYTVKLRDGAAFHDGSKVTTDDVVFSFTRIIDPANKSLFSQFVPFIDKVEATDASTVKFTLKYPFPGFGPRISVVKIVPKALTNFPVGSDQLKAFDAKPVGTGPYKFVSAAKDDKIVFARNDAYNGQHKALAAGMTWLLVSDNSARVSAMQGGKVQAIEDVPYLDVDGLKSRSKVESVQSFGLLFMMFNCAKAPFDKKEVRQALHYALDTETIIKKILLGNAKSATSYFQDTHADYQEAATVYNFDAEKAKKLLSDAGVSNLSVSAISTDTGWVKTIVPLIQQNWEAVGLKVNFEVLASAAAYGNDKVGGGKFDVLIAPGDPSVFGNDADLLLSWFFAGSTWVKNRMYWTAPEAATVQSDLTKAAQATGDDAKKIYKTIIDTIADQAPLYPLFHRQLPTAWDDKKLSGFQPLPTTGLAFIDVGRTK
ncbi:MAG: ABC transporter substrate-binding protein [Acidobacteria bacterium]|nr:ABC transporter substrate-binding protein [Acidobacteriota bacterium]